MSRIITRRAAVAGIAAASAVPLARRAHADLAALEDAARKEGTLTWYVAQMSGEAAEDMGRSFTRKYPGISVTVIRTTGQVAYQRVLQELKNSTPQCDVFCSTDNSHYPALKARNALAQYKPQNAGALAPPFVGLGDEEGQMMGSHRMNLFAQLFLPTKDLAAPPTVGADRARFFDLDQGKDPDPA